MEKNLVPAIVLGVAVLLLLGAVFTKAWFRKSVDLGGASVTVGVGLWGTFATEACARGKCESNSSTLAMSDAPDTKSKAWLVSGRVGFVVALLTALLLVAVAVMFVTDNENLARAAFVANIMVAAAFVCSMLFVVLKPDGMPGLSYSAFLFFAGAIAGASGATMAGKQAG